MHFLRSSRLFIASAAITGFVLIALALVIGFTSESTRAGELPSSDAILAQQIADSDNECVVCHTDHTPGIINQYGLSSHYSNDVTCADCHEVEADYPGAVEHPDADFHVLTEVTPAQCETCHVDQVRQFNLSRHGLPAYVAYAGAEPLSDEHLELYLAIPEGQGYDARARSDLHELEGEAVTRFACESCHNIGAPNLDGSVGNCSDCHLRHEFSLEQARKPETCNACHIGPDHPQWEIYQESAHGIAYMTGGDDWNWDAEPGTLTTVDMPAPTCATCHMSGFGLSATTHDVGDRLTWFLAAPISTERPAAIENEVRMQQVCNACHTTNFIESFYEDADELVYAINDWVMLSDAMVQPLIDNDLLTPQPFDEPIDYVYFNLWHHWGRTAKFGAWMQGPDYTQWHGAYELMNELAELREMVDHKLEEAGLEPLDLPETFPSNASAREYLEQIGWEQE